MGMTCTLYRAAQAEIDHLIEEPAAFENFLDPDDGSAPRVRTVRPKGLLGLALRLFPITITEVVSDPREDVASRAIDPDRSLDIDKGWHGLHFLFTGTADSGDKAKVPSHSTFCGRLDAARHPDRGRIRRGWV